MNIASWLNHTVTMETRTGLNEHGDPTWSAQSTVAARVTHRQSVRLSGRNERISNYEIASLVEIPLGARVWLPGDDTTDDNDARRVVDSENADDKSGSTRLYIAYV